MCLDLIERIILCVVLVSSASGLIFLYLRKPIEKDRYLYGDGAGVRMLWISLLWTVCVISIIVVAAWLYELCGGVSLPKALIGNNGRHNGSDTLLWAVLSQFADPGNLPNAEKGSHVIALISAFAGIICLAGLIVSSFVNGISRKAMRWRKGEINYKSHIKNYVIIIGTNEQASTIIRDSLNRVDVDYILVQTRKDVESARRQLWLKLNREEEKRVVFYSGERTSSEDIKALHVERAKEIYILGEEMGYENEQDHDAFNINCLELISKDYESKTKKKSDSNYKIKCFVALEYQSTYTIFKSTQIYSTINKNIEFIPFNVQELWAKRVLVDGYAVVPAGADGKTQVYRYLPIDGEDGISFDSPKTVHFVVVGMNQMGTALAMQVALMAHFPNYESDATRKRRTTITFIDEQAVKESEYFIGRFSSLFDLARYRVVSDPAEVSNAQWIDPMEHGRYKYLGKNFMDIQWEFIQGNVAADCIQKYLISIAEDRSKICTVAVCLNDPQLAIAGAVYLPEKLLKQVQQVLVYQRNSFDMINKVSTGEKQWKRYNKLRPFGMIEGSYKERQSRNEVAKLAYFLYRERRLPEATDYEISRLDKWWNELGLLEKMYNLDLSDAIEMKLRSVKTPDSIINGDGILKHYQHAEHNRWLTEKLTFGFRPLEQSEYLRIAPLAISAGEDDRKRRDFIRMKEHFKAKYRAHIDICSNESIDSTDPGTRKNERLILANLGAMKDLHYQITIRRTYYLTNDERPLKGKKEDDIQLFIHDRMAEINKDHHHFWMSKTPVTQKQWERIMGADSNNSHNKRKSIKGKAKFPVEMISWYDVQDYICVLNDRTGLNFRLPTIQEWNIAAQGKPVANRAYPCCSDDINHPRVTSGEIGSYENEYGLLDILGNVWEWTGSLVSQKDETSGRQYVETLCNLICGGSWRFCGDSCLRPMSRIRSFKSQDLGFRLLLPLNHPIDTSPKYDNSVAGAVVLENLPSNEFVTVFKRKAENSEEFVPLFKIGRTPVTQLQWRSVMADEDEKIKNPSQFSGDNLPVENVSFKDVSDFLNKLNRKSSGYHYRLPKESEWEYVANGGCSPHGYEYAGESRPDDVAWTYEIARSTHPVKYMEPVNIAPCVAAMEDDNVHYHEYDVYDMCGNVWEWCDDGDGITRVAKGGSWRYEKEDCRITSEMEWIEEYKSDDLGFRLVMDIDEHRPES